MRSTRAKLALVPARPEPPAAVLKVAAALGRMLAEQDMAEDERRRARAAEAAPVAKT